MSARRNSVLTWHSLSAVLRRRKKDTGDVLTSWPHAQGQGNPPVDEIMAQLSAFLQTYRLDLTPATVAAGLDYVTGRNPELRELVDARITNQEPITTAWLNAVCCDQFSQPGDQFEAIFEMLDTNIGQFDKTARTARRATREYGAVLQSHARELQEGARGTGTAEQQVVRLAGVLAAMAERTEKLEADLEKSQKQSQSLKKKLDTLQRKANLDHLTGLPNRRAFERIYAEQIETAKTEGEGLCVAFCDVDHFKRVNDTHGHDAGDRVLRAIARKLAALSDDHCHVARHGGEEFVLLFRGVTLSEACAMLDRAREDLAARRMINRRTDEPIGFVTISAGVADALAYDCPRAALEAADQALYVAKESGRNQVCKAPLERRRPRKNAA